MIVVIKIFKAYVSLGNLGIFFRGNTSYSKEGAFFHGELAPFHNENALFLGEVVFFTRELFLLHGECVWDLYLIFFAQGNDFLKEIN